MGGNGQVWSTPASVTAFLVLGCTLWQAPLAWGQQQDESVMLRQHTLHESSDPNFLTHTILAPAGWTVSGGGYVAAPQYYHVPITQDISAHAPNGSFYKIAPRLVIRDPRPNSAPRPAQGTAIDGLPVMHLPDTLEQWRDYYNQTLLPKSYPQAAKAEVSKVSRLTEFDQLIQRQLAPIRQELAQIQQNGGGRLQTFCDGMFMAVESAITQDQREYEELNVVRLVSLGADTAQGRDLRWVIDSCAFRWPKGEAERYLPIMISAASSMRTTPRWDRFVADHDAKIRQTDLRGALQRSKIMADTYAEIGRISQAGFQNRMRIRDAGHQRYIDSIREVDVWGAGDSAVRLPSGYDRVFHDGAGNYIMTNDQFYHPNSDLNVSSAGWEAINRQQ